MFAQMITRRIKNRQVQWYIDILKNEMFRKRLQIFKNFSWKERYLFIW